MRSRAPAAAALGIVAWGLALAACGDGNPPPAGEMLPGHWKVSDLAHVKSTAALSVRGPDLFLLASGGDRNLFHVQRSAAHAGGTAQPRAIPLRVRGENLVGGRDALAAEGFALSTLWDLPMEWVGLAVDEDDRLYLAERRMRVVYFGALVRDGAGAVVEGRIDGAFSVVGGDRSGRRALDWSDQRRGLAGMALVPGKRGMGVLHFVERGAPGTSGGTLRALDSMTGAPLGPALPLEGPDSNSLNPLALAYDASRFLLLCGGGRGAIFSFDDPGSRPVRLTQSAPGPRVEGVVDWGAMAAARDGTLYLASASGRSVLVWRAP